MTESYPLVNQGRVPEDHWAPGMHVRIMTLVIDEDGGKWLYDMGDRGTVMPELEDHTARSRAVRILPDKPLADSPYGNTHPVSISLAEEKRMVDGRRVIARLVLEPTAGESIASD